MLDEQHSVQTVAPGTAAAPRRKNLVLACVDGLNLVLRWTVGLMLFTMVVIVFLQILVRFALPAVGIVISVPWTEELARYLMIWCIFLGAAAASRSGDLIAMDTLTTCVSPRNGWRIKLFAYLVTIGFFVFLFVVGMRWMGFGFMESSTVMNVPMSAVYLAMPVGSALAVINIVFRALEGHQRMCRLAAGDTAQ